MRLVKQPAKTLDDKEVGRLHAMFQRAFHRDRDYYDRMMRYRRELAAGNLPDVAHKSEALTTIDLFHAYVRSMFPTLFFHDPHFKCTADHPDYVESSEVWEKLIAVLIEKSGYSEETSRVVLDALVYGKAWKLWSYHKAADDPEIETGEAKMVDKESTSGTRGEHGRLGPSRWEGLDIPVGYRISPLQVATDSITQRLEDSRFVVIKHKKLLSELIEDPRYTVSEEIREKVRVNNWPKNPSEQHGSPFQPEDPWALRADLDEEDYTVTLYEGWIYQLAGLKLYKQVVSIVDGFHHKLARPIMSWSDYVGPFVKGYPITTLDFWDIPDFRTINQFDTWRNLSRTVNLLMSRIIAMSKNQKQIYNFCGTNARNAEKAMQDLLSGSLTVVVDCHDINAPAVAAIPPAPIPGDIFNAIQILQSFITQVSGLGQNRRGTAGVRTATEAQLIEQGTQIRTDDMVRRIDRFMQADGRILVDMIRHTTPRDFVFRATDDVGNIGWGKFTEWDASWSPDVRVMPSSSRKVEDQETIQKLFQALQVALQSVPVLGQAVRVDIIMRQLFEALGVRGVEQIIPTQMEARIKQMTEIILMVSGTPVPVLPTDNHQAEGQMVMEFMQTEAFMNLDPNAQAIIAKHNEEHMIALEQLQANAPKTSAPGKSMPGFEGDNAERSVGEEEADNSGFGDSMRQSQAYVGGASGGQ